MPDNLTASEVEELKRLRTFVSFNPAMTNSSDFKVMEAFWPHLPELLRAWEEQSKMALDLLSAETQAQNAVSRAETAERERDEAKKQDAATFDRLRASIMACDALHVVLKSTRDDLAAARAEVADLKRERDDAKMEILDWHAKYDAARAECERLREAARNSICPCERSGLIAVADVLRLACNGGPS